MVNPARRQNSTALLLGVLGLGVARCGGQVDDVHENVGEAVCATHATLRGVDVSSYQRTVDWNAVRAAGYSFAFAKSSEGTSLVDPYFARNWAGIRAAGMARGAYHYFHPGSSVSAQVRLVLATVGALRPDDLPIVLDFETLDGLSESTAVANAVTFLQAVANMTGRTPIVYVSAGFLSRSYPALAPFPLWVANYGVRCPRVPLGRSTWTFWQDSESGRVSGIPGADVDLDYFNGTREELTALFGDLPDDAGAPTPDASTVDAAVASPDVPRVDASAPDVIPLDAGGGDAGAGDAGAGDAGAGDAGAGDAGVPGTPTCALGGQSYPQNTCTETLQCGGGRWGSRAANPMNCLHGVLSGGACLTNRGAVVPLNTCTSTLQCDNGVWGDRSVNPMRCR